MTRIRISKLPTERPVLPLTQRITALRNAITKTLSAISESTQEVESIAQSTLDEVKRLEHELESVQAECNAAISQVERLERDSRAARERLLVVNRDVNKYSEQDMKKAYDSAQQTQVDLGQWRERELQLRFRRDDIARRLKALRATAHQAELLMVKFHQTEQYLTSEFEDVGHVLEIAHVQAVIGMQMLQMQEEERRWLATKLHDGPMQSLATIGMLIKSEFTTPSEETGEVRRRLNRVVGDLRQVVFDLRPPLIDDLGLVPTLKRYAAQWAEGHNLTVKVELVGLEVPLTPTEKITVFRVVQDTLNNVAIHSQATHVTITIVYACTDLQVRIADNGVGIGEADWTGWVEAGKLGLTLCRQRMNLLGGTMQVENDNPTGTKVVYTLPIQRGRE